MRPGYLLSALAGVALGVTLTSAGATTLTMENVINRVPRSGAAGPNDPFGPFGLCQPTVINPGDGQPFLTACAPGEMGRYPAEGPRDEGSANDVRAYTNAPYNITSLTLQIVGSAVEPVPFDFTITLDPTSAHSSATPTGAARPACRTSSARSRSQPITGRSPTATVSCRSAEGSPTSSFR